MMTQFLVYQQEKFNDSKYYVDNVIWNSII